MGTKTHTVVLFALLLLSVTACAASGSPPSASRGAPPDAPMVAELTDLSGSFPAYGRLDFQQGTSGEEFIEAGVLGNHGGQVGVGGRLSHARVADLVAGRLVETTGVGDDAFQLMRFTHPSGVEVLRRVVSIRLSLLDASTVQFTAQLGAAEGIGMPAPPDVAQTATLTARGQFRLTCTIPPAPGDSSVRMDPAFSSPYCAALRTELGLDALLAISNSI